LADESLYLGRGSGILRNIGGILMPAKINKDECVACGACVDVCPEGAIAVDDVAVVDVKKCLDCGACVDECPNNAIVVDEKK
jgi:ferredoxin